MATKLHPDRQALAIARDLIDFCEHLGMPYGFNLESVSNRKAEIAATTELASDISTLLRRGLGDEVNRQ